MKSSARAVLAALCVVVALSGTTSAQQPGGHRFGGGVHYWRTIDNIRRDYRLHREGIAWIVNYQYVLMLFNLELGVEVFPQGYYGSTQTAIAPHAFVGLSTPIYGALGMGTVTSGDLDGTFSAPFYILRAGLNIELLPGFYLDVNGNYYFTDWDTVEDVNTDTITLGAQARFAF